MKAALAAILLFAFGSAGAQGYPDRPVRILVGYPPGGGTDLVARLIAQPLSERWKQPVVVENRPGANAIIATEAAAKAKPDGYTLLMAYATELAVNPATFKNLPYDPCAISRRSRSSPRRRSYSRCILRCRRKRSRS